MRCPFLLITTLIIILTAAAYSKYTQYLSKPDVELLASDVHVQIAGKSITLPWISLEDYAYFRQSFSLDRTANRKRETERRDAFRVATLDRVNAPELDSVRVIVRTYGWNDFDMRQREMCSLLTRQWSRSVCDNPWAAVQQAIPGSFALVDLGRLELTKGPANCTDASAKLVSSVPRGSKASLLCDFNIIGSKDTRFYTAIVQISDELGAVWAVWESEKSKETAAEQALREGRAVVALVQNGLGNAEYFSELHRTVCQLRRPNAPVGPTGSDCD